MKTSSLRMLNTVLLVLASVLLIVFIFFSKHLNEKWIIGFEISIPVLFVISYLLERKIKARK